MLPRRRGRTKTDHDPPPCYTPPMCGRFTDRYTWRELKELYDITTPYLTSNFPPRFNIAPTQMSFGTALQ